MLVTEEVNGSKLLWDNAYTHSVREYYLYCVDLFRKVLRRSPVEDNFVFGEFDAPFPAKRIYFQYEHTLVKPGGRDSEGFYRGEYPCSTKDNYLVRLVNYQAIEKADIVIEYSKPNMMNVIESSLYPAYTSKVVYVSPSFYSINFKSEKSIDVITNFYDPNQPRRAKLLAAAGSRIKNVTGCYGTELQALYNRTKILVNIHQTDHHDTLEELRILPALRSGCMVITEFSGLQHRVPYIAKTIWSDYTNIIGTVDHFLKDYDEYRRDIFTPKFSSMLRQLEIDNYANIDEIIRR